MNPQNKKSQNLNQYVEKSRSEIEEEISFAKREKIKNYLQFD